MNTQPESLGVHKRMTALTILLFALFIGVESFYLVYGYSHELTIYQGEDCARLAHSCSIATWINPLATGNPWLPLPHAIQWTVFQVFPGQKILLLGSITQKILTIAAGLIAALLAGKITKSWLAVALTLTAWAGSTRLSLISIGYLSEPTLHLAMLAAIYCGYCWWETKKASWRALTIVAVVAMELSRYEGWVLAGFIWCVWLVLMVKNHHQSITKKAVAGFTLVAATPLAWCAYNFLYSGDPLRFLRITHDCMLVNVPVTELSWKLGFLSKFASDLLSYQPTVIVGLILLAAFPSCWKGSLFLVAMILAVLGVNIALTLGEATAPFYAERLPSNIYVFWCVLFGTVGYKFLTKINPKKTLFVLALTILVVTTLGINGFLTQIPEQTNNFRAMSTLVAGRIPTKSG